METKREVKTIQVDYVCPECDYGKLRPIGTVLTTYPVQFPHKCTECDYTNTFSIEYPYLEYETINL